MTEKKKNKNLLNLIITLLLIAVTCVYFYLSFDLSEVMEGLAKADYTVLIIGFTAVIIYTLCYGILAKTVLRAFDRKISVARGFLYGTTDFYYSALTPSASGGQPMVIYNMAKDGIPASIASFATFLHTAIFKAVLILFNVISLFVCYQEFSSASITFEVLWFVGIGINVLMILLCLFSMFKRGMTLKVASFTLRLLGKMRFIRNADERIEAFSVSLEEYGAFAGLAFKNFGLIVKSFIIVIIQRAAFFSVAYIVYRGMGYSEYNWLYFLCIQAMISMAVDSLPLPGGIGANEAALVFTLETVYGTPEAAATATLLIRLINYYFPMIISTIGTFTEQLLQRKGSKSESRKIT